MKIAQVAPLAESVPPKLYGGTERVVSYLTEELVALGHQVTLFASGDSVTAAELVAVCPTALRLAEEPLDPAAEHAHQMELVARRASEFDVIHFHTDWSHAPVFSRLQTPFLTTLHGRLDLASVRRLLGSIEVGPLVSISAAQRTPVPDARWLGTVHHGLPRTLLRPGFARGDYLAFLGRICPEKCPETAIRVSQEAGLPLRLAAKVDKADREYFDVKIRPLLKCPGVEFIGEIQESEKESFLGSAIALLFPIDWPEPFGMVLIEAMACATPVIAMRRGSVPEIVRPGIGGYVVDSKAGFLEAVGRIDSCSRAGVRHEFEERFTVRRMAEEYLALYSMVVRRHSPAVRKVRSRTRGTDAAQAWQYACEPHGLPPRAVAVTKPPSQ